MALSCEELTHWKRPWCFERLKMGREGIIRGSNGWMTSPTQWAWVWVNSGSWWWTGRPGMLQSMGSQRVRHVWAAELTDVPYAVLHLSQSCLTLCNFTDYSPPGSSVHGDSPGQNTVVDCHALLKGIFPTQGSSIVDRFFTICAIRETQEYWSG